MKNKYTTQSMAEINKELMEQQNLLDDPKNSLGQMLTSRSRFDSIEESRPSFNNRKSRNIEISIK